MGEASVKAQIDSAGYTPMDTNDYLIIGGFAGVVVVILILTVWTNYQSEKEDLSDSEEYLDSPRTRG
jgi:hypothetical protein